MPNHSSAFRSCVFYYMYIVLVQYSVTVYCMPYTHLCECVCVKWSTCFRMTWHSQAVCGEIT